jgi:hypothetical protein
MVWRRPVAAPTPLRTGPVDGAAVTRADNLDLGAHRGAFRLRGRLLVSVRNSVRQGLGASLPLSSRTPFGTRITRADDGW